MLFLLKIGTNYILLKKYLSTNYNSFLSYLQEPLVSLSIDFYVRIFVRVFTSQVSYLQNLLNKNSKIGRFNPIFSSLQKKCKESTSKLGHLYQCTGCETITYQPLGQVIKDEKNNVKYVLPKGPPVDQKCKFCQHSHLIGGLHIFYTLCSKT